MSGRGGVTYQGMGSVVGGESVGLGCDVAVGGVVVSLRGGGWCPRIGLWHGVGCGGLVGMEVGCIRAVEALWGWRRGHVHAVVSGLPWHAVNGGGWGWAVPARGVGFWGVVGVVSRWLLGC